MTRQPLLPSPVQARQLADLVADARAIPSAAFACCADRELALADVPTQQTAMRIPESTVSLVEAADDHWAGFSR